MSVVTMGRNFTSLRRQVRNISYKNVSGVNMSKAFKQSATLITSKVSRQRDFKNLNCAQLILT